MQAPTAKARCGRPLWAPAFQMLDPRLVCTTVIVVVTFGFPSRLPARSLRSNTTNTHPCPSFCLPLRSIRSLAAEYHSSSELHSSRVPRGTAAAFSPFAIQVKDPRDETRRDKRHTETTCHSLAVSLKPDAASPTLLRLLVRSLLLRVPTADGALGLSSTALSCVPVKPRSGHSYCVMAGIEKLEIHSKVCRASHMEGAREIMD